MYGLCTHYVLSFNFRRLFLLNIPTELVTTFIFVQNTQTFDFLSYLIQKAQSLLLTNVEFKFSS